MATLESLAREDWVRAHHFYGNGSPNVVGRLILGMPDAESLPIDADHIYSAALQTVHTQHEVAHQWAHTFGKLSIAITPLEQPSSFQFESSKSYIPQSAAELQSGKRFPLEELITSQSDHDAPVTHLLCGNELPIKPEMALIQILHLIDTAIVTGNLGRNGRMPNIQLIDPTELAKLRKDNPDLLLRLYGNVRKKTDTPLVLGTVASTSLIERQKIATRPLKSMQKPANQVRIREAIEIPRPVRGKLSYVGITSAKEPHIGHGFLIVKAFADKPYGSSVIVKLNDTGPRVAGAISVLADQHGISFEDMATKVSSGEVTFEEVKAAYQGRQSDITPPLPIDFQLKAPNEYYREITSKLQPLPNSIQVTSDSELSAQKEKILDHPRTIHTLSGHGPAFLYDEVKPVVLETSGQLTLKGLLVILGVQADLHIVSSPRTFSKSELATLHHNGIEIRQTEGTGVSIDFDIASGTRGNSLNINRLFDIARSNDYHERLILPALRHMLNEAYFIPGEAESINPNFASVATIEQGFLKAIELIASHPNPASLLEEPLRLINITHIITKDFMGKIYAGAQGGKGKFTESEVSHLLAKLPGLSNYLSHSLVGHIQARENPEGTIPKNILTESDRMTLDSLRAGKPALVVPLINSLSAEQNDIKAILEDTYLLRIGNAMGYDDTTLAGFVANLCKVKGVYKVNGK